VSAADREDEEAACERATVALAYALVEAGATDDTVHAAMDLVDHMVSQGAGWAVSADQIRRAVRAHWSEGGDTSVIGDWSAIAAGGTLDDLAAALDIGRFAAAIHARWAAPQGTDVLIVTDYGQYDLVPKPDGPGYTATRIGDQP
jgi:hypothetical protein